MRLDTFLKFEKEEGVFKRTYLGVPYWQTIRLYISRKMLYNVEPVRSKAHVIKKVIDIFRECIYDIKNWSRLSECELLYFDQGRYRLVNGVQIDKNFEYFHFENFYKVKHCYYLNIPNAYNLNREINEGIACSYARIIRGLKKITNSIFSDIFRDKKEEEFLKELTLKLKKKLGVNITYEDLLHRVRDITLTHWAFEKYYEKLLDKARPKAVFVVCHYEPCLFPLYKVAKKKKIPVIELEHGSVVCHDAYTYGDLSDVGKELPDYLFTYGDFWNRLIDLPEMMKPISIGNPFLEDQKRNYMDILTDDKIIVYYSDTIFQKESENFILKLYKKYHSRGYQIYYKLHPNEYGNWKQVYTKLSIHKGINVLSDEIELYKLLKMAKHHVGRMSTVLYEALVFDVQIYVYMGDFENEGGKLYSELGMARAFWNIEELDALLQNSYVKEPFSLEEVWKSRAAENGLNALQEIITQTSHINFSYAP